LGCAGFSLRQRRWRRWRAQHAYHEQQRRAYEAYMNAQPWYSVLGHPMVALAMPFCSAAWARYLVTSLSPHPEGPGQQQVLHHQQHRLTGGRRSGGKQGQGEVASCILCCSGTL
jgi:hypothetical protein